MESLTPYKRSFNDLIHVINGVDNLTFFNYSVDAEHHIAVMDVSHVDVESAVDVVVAALRRVSNESRALVDQVGMIVREVLDQRRSCIDGFIKSAKSDLVSCALVRAPYAEACLDVRIAIALNEDSVVAARDYIHYELGITTLKQLNPTNPPGVRTPCQNSPSN